MKRRVIDTKWGHRMHPEPADAGTALILTADTGGGHRAATEAIAEALPEHDPRQPRAVSCDPLTGPGAPRALRRICGWYGPVIRHAPWLWGIIFHLTDTRPGRWMLRRLLSHLTAAPIVAAIRRHAPAVLVIAHPLLVEPAVRARHAHDQQAHDRQAHDRQAHDQQAHDQQTTARQARRGNTPLVTIVTDLASAHGTWWSAEVDRTIVPSDTLLRAGRRAGAANLHDRPVGIPVGARFRRSFREPRCALRERLGLRTDGFLVLVTAGGEGGTVLGAWTRTILESVPDVDVVTVCGRNASLHARLGRLAARHGHRLRVTGEVPNMADWIHASDLVVSKAGPSIIAEATALGVPLLLPTHLPGQEAGNAELAVAAGAARRVRGRRDLDRTVAALQRDAAEMARMRESAARWGRPDAALAAADLIAAQGGLDHRSADPRGRIGSAARAPSPIREDTRTQRKDEHDAVA